MNVSGTQVCAPTDQPPVKLLAGECGMPIQATHDTLATDIFWYLIQTKPRQEFIALDNLSRQGYECYLPRLSVEKIRSRKLTLVSEAMFPRYLFIRLGCNKNALSWSPIRSTVGVSQLVRFGSNPAKVDELLIDTLKNRENYSQPERLFKPGETVSIVEGSFKGLEAVFHMVNGEERSIILLEMMSKSVAMSIEHSNLRQVS